MNAIYITEPRPTTSPISGQCQPSSAVAPTSITTEGSRAISSVSLSWSTAHMPRVILRTVEPAKLLACQSVDRRCTRWKALDIMPFIMRSVKPMML